MNLSDLLKSRLVEKFEPDSEQIGNVMEVAQSNIKSAKNVLAIQEWEIAHNTAYNAMFQAARALMFANGYRPTNQEDHLAVISFIQVAYSAKFGPELFKAFDNARKKRNESWYEHVGSIPPRRAESLVMVAEEFVSRAAELLKKENLSESS